MKFTSIREFKHSREYSAPYESVLAILQDPYRLCAHSPHFDSMVPDDDESKDSGAQSNSPASGGAEDPKKGRLSKTQWYIITDRIPVIGPVKATIKARVKIMPVDDGADTEVEAGLGTKLRAKYRVERKTVEGGGERCALSEDTNVEVRRLVLQHRRTS